MIFVTVFLSAVVLYIIGDIIERHEERKRERYYAWLRGDLKKRP